MTQELRSSCNDMTLTSQQQLSLRASSTSTSSTKERWRKVLVNRNKGFLAQPINRVGLEVSLINSLFPPVDTPPQVKKTLFPRSVVYEIPYKKKQAQIKIQEALRKEREALAQRVKMKLAESLQRSDHQLNQQDEKDKEMERMMKDKEPFWYREAQQADFPPRNMSEYDVDKGLRVDRPDDVHVKERMGIADSRNYIPGQVSGTVPSRPLAPRAGEGIQATQTTAHPPLPSLPPSHDPITQTQRTIENLERECHPTRPLAPAGPMGSYPIDYMRKKITSTDRPRGATAYQEGDTDRKASVCKDLPGAKARLTTPWGDLRSHEFIKVGRPFKTQAARWTECAMPAFNPQEELQAIRERLTTKYQLENK